MVLPKHEILEAVERVHFPSMFTFQVLQSKLPCHHGRQIAEFCLGEGH
jgi:hypothetical protein